MREIYCLLGQIVETAQYIEYNLALMIRLNEVLKEFYRRGAVSIDEYEYWEIEEEARYLQDQLNNMTMGNILNMVRRVRLFSYGEAEVLKRVLENRNAIIHRFFKDDDFGANAENPAFINGKKRRLREILSEMKTVNAGLCEVVRMLRLEYESIK